MTDSEAYERFQSRYNSDTPPPWDSGIVPPEVCALVEGESPLTPGRALDVGCGTGTSAVYLAQNGWHVTGVDWIETAVQRARERAAQAGINAESIRFLRQNVLSPDFLRDHPPVDLWLDVGCLHGFDRQAKQTYAGHVKRLIAPGGTLLIYGWAAHERDGIRRGLDVDETRDLFAPELTIVHIDHGLEATDTSFASVWLTLRRVNG